MIRVAKEVCKRCRNESNFPWRDIDDELYTDGSYVCGDVRLREYRNYNNNRTDQSLPEWCPHAGEHVYLLSSKKGRLSKEICIRCCNDYASRNKHRQDSDYYLTKTDDKRWEESYVVCPVDDNGSDWGCENTSVNRGAPDWCLHSEEQERSFENAVVIGMENKNV